LHVVRIKSDAVGNQHCAASTAASWMLTIL
jgi:hypothetical protein